MDESFDLGMGPAPSAPTPPQPVSGALGKGGQIAQMIAMALGGAMGPGAGTGLLAGLAHGLQQKQQRADVLNQRNQQTYERQQQDYLRQQELFAREDMARRKAVADAYDGLAKLAPSLKTRAEFDAAAGRYASLLQGMGIRIPPQQLAQSVPYLEPTERDLVAKAINANQKAYPEAWKNGAPLNAHIQYDYQGQPRDIQIGKAIQQGLVSLPIDEASGKWIGAEATKPPTLTPREGVMNGREVFWTMGADGTPQEVSGVQPKPDKPNAGDEPLMPEDVQGAAQAILSGRMAPSQLSLVGGMGNRGVKFKQAVVAEVNKRQPDFNWQSAEAGYKFASAPATQNTIRFLDNIEKTLPVLEQASRDFKRSGVRLINKGTLAAKSQFGDTSVTTFEFARNILADEIAKILQGGGTGNGTSDAKLKQAQDLLAGDMTPQQFDAAIAAARELLGTRRESLTKGTFMERSSDKPKRKIYDASGKLLREE